MYETKDIQLLIVGIVLVGIGWFLPGSARLGGIVMLMGAAVMLVAQFRMLRGRRKDKS